MRRSTHGSYLRFARSALGMGAAAVLAACLMSPCARANEVLSNLPNTVNGGSGLSDVGWKAVLFTTGNVATRISSIEIGLNPPDGGVPPISPSVKVSLFSVTENAPGVELATTGSVTVDIVSLQATYLLASLSGFNLDASASYALVVASDATGIKWGRSANSTPTASEGFTYDGFLVTADAGATWSTLADNGFPIAMDNAFAITVVPEPSALPLGLACLGLAGLAARRRRARTAR